MAITDMNINGDKICTVTFFLRNWQDSLISHFRPALYSTNPLTKKNNGIRNNANVPFKL